MCSVNDFIFGTGSLGSRFSSKKFRKFFKLANDLNIYHYDISFFYGKGLAQKYLIKSINNTKNKYSLTIKYGRQPTLDLKTILVNFYRLEFKNLFDIYNQNSIDYTFSDIKNFIESYLAIKNKNIYYPEFFFHGPAISIEKKLDQKVFQYLKDKSFRVGYTEPFADSLDFICKSGKFQIIHLSTQEYLDNSLYINKNFSGEIWLNGIIKFSRKEKISWCKLCKDLKKINNNLKFVIGFNNSDLFEELNINFFKI